MASSVARAISLQVSLNGQVVPGAISAGISQNSYRAADRFRLEFALDLAGDWLAGLATTDVISVAVGIDETYVSLISGGPDSVVMDVIAGVAHVAGRDLAARFIDAPFDETFQNRTSSEIVGALCAKRGIAAAVAPTSTLVGRYFEDQHARTVLSQFTRVSTEWDLLVWLAESEGFDLWVQSNTLNFGPRLDASAALPLAPTDCITFELERLLPLEGGIGVTVKSWDCLGQRTVSQSAGGVSGVGGYVVVRPNLSLDVAQSLADSLSAASAEQAVQLRASMPGELSIFPRTVLLVEQSGTGLDGLFTVSEVERRLSVEHGFTQYVEARSTAWMPS